jgi:hypothetical protein
MEVVLLTIVVIGALSIIVGGVWVAVELIRALAAPAPRVRPFLQWQADKEGNNQDKLYRVCHR